MAYRIANMLLLGGALSAWAIAPVAAQTGAPKFELNVEHVDGADDDKVYQITSSGTVAATQVAVWRILTDYGHFADYLPNLTSVRVVSRNGDSAVVEQLGTARFLFFSQPIRLLVQVKERAPEQIDINLIDGDMKVYRASWKFTPLPGAAGTRVEYRASIVPKFDVPGIVGTSVVRKDIARMMGAVLTRLERPD
jgi:ribosome-associated toxin RatA of RatAB toxin-antitoxin module